MFAIKSSFLNKILNLYTYHVLKIYFNTNKIPIFKNKPTFSPDNKVIYNMMNLL